MDYIYAIYKTGSFSKAAEQLFISQPALSIAVRKLEDELGQKLFFRTTGTVELTEAGKAFEHELFDLLRRRMAEAYAEAGQQAVGGFWSVLRGLLPPDLREAVADLQQGD